MSSDQQVAYPTIVEEPSATTVDESTPSSTQSTSSSSSERLPLTPLKPASKGTPLLETVKKVLGKVSVVVIQPIIAGFCFGM